MKRTYGNGCRGFTLIEMVVVVVIISTVVAMALFQVNSMLPRMRANAALAQVEGVFRTARALAVGQRRNIQVQFQGNNQIQITRLEVPNGATVLNTITLGNSVLFTLLGMPDTPDRFGNQSAVEFAGLNGGPPVMLFLSDGTFVDGNGNPINGTAFLGIPNLADTARAVTILGATGRVRSYHAQGAAWVEE